jgi:hypothetical protein
MASCREKEAMPCFRSRTRSDSGVREKGAVLVEAAIVIPVLIIILLGIIDFGFAFNSYISLRQGTRETGRQMVVSTTPQPTSGSWSCPITGLPGVDSSATAGTANADIYDLICYSKSRIGLDQTSTRVSLFWDKPFTPNTTASATDSVIVCTQYPLNSITGIFSPMLNGTIITAKTEIRIEQASADLASTNPPMQETALSKVGGVPTWPASCTTT